MVKLPYRELLLGNFLVVHAFYLRLFQFAVKSFDNVQACFLYLLGFFEVLGVDGSLGGSLVPVCLCLFLGYSVQGLLFTFGDLFLQLVQFFGELFSIADNFLVFGNDIIRLLYGLFIVLNYGHIFFVLSL